MKSDDFLELELEALPKDMQNRSRVIVAKGLIAVYRGYATHDSDAVLKAISLLVVDLQAEVVERGGTKR